MDRFDLSDEPMPGQPLIEIVGCSRVLIEHHNGVCAYGQEMICVNVRYGRICITGQSLELKRMTRGQLIICGCIESVLLERR